MVLDGAAADRERKRRRALPEPVSGLVAGYTAPTAPEEILLCELVAELLGWSEFGLADNFFYLKAGIR